MIAHLLLLALQVAVPLFSAEEPIRFSLTADFSRLERDRSQESEERPATVRVVGSDGEAVEIEIEVRTRGRFRLQRRICPDPPLRLDFPDTPVQGTVFDGQDKLKLVNHCRDSDGYEQNVLEEYLAYRIYNELTEVSFRVRLAEVTYLDSSGKNDPVTRMAFLLESEEALGRRLGGKVLEVQGSARPDEFVIDQIGLVYLFQFMIGNVDWGTGTGHNIEILLKDGAYYPIPRDFDWSGLVDAPYAEPNRLTKDLHDSVRERVYWGVCMAEIQYDELFASFQEARASIVALPSGIPGLSKANSEIGRAHV